MVTPVLVQVTVLSVGIIAVSRSPQPHPLAASLTLLQQGEVMEPLALLQKKEKVKEREHYKVKENKNENKIKSKKKNKIKKTTWFSEEQEWG